MEILNIKNLTFTYPNARIKALDNINLSVAEGDFVLLTGASGSGKTTLLRLLKDETAPFGEIRGVINKKALSIALVFQDAENQIVSDTVWHNLAFALENMNKSSDEIRQKVGEIAEYFDIAHIFRKKTSCLSGGEKQLLNLASVMVTDPDVLLLDEPTSQLDPIAAKNFLDTVKRLNAEMNLTVIISEHRTEELFNYAHKVCVMDKGCIIIQGKGSFIADKINLQAIERPFGTELYNLLGRIGNCPVTVGECRRYIRNNFKNDVVDEIIEEKKQNETALEMKNIYFRYTKNGEDVLRKLNFSAKKGEILTLIGGNGSGKTTLLSLISGINKPYSGKVKTYKNRIALLPQNVKTVFTKDVLKKDFALITDNFEIICKELNISHLLDRNPYDLSGGEVQRAALAKVLLTNPDILCLDEPTKGIDAKGKRDMQKILKNLKNRGVSIIIVTHDADFAAEISDYSAFLFDGQIVSEGTPREVFSKNTFYTTLASRVSRNFYKNAVTIGDIENLCKRNGQY